MDKFVFLFYSQLYKILQHHIFLKKEKFVTDNLINKTINGENCDIPVWFLRQAGRHIPEYYEIRQKEKNFIKFCLNEDLIIKSTELPLKYYDLDAAIIFSDILMIPWAMNRNLKFTKNFQTTNK